MLNTPRSKVAIGALLVVTLIWGWTFSWMKTAIETAGPFVGDALPFVVGLFMVVRFGVAAVLMPIVVPASRRGILQVCVWRDGGWLALLLLGGFFLQMFALDDVSPAVSAFLTSLYVAFTALLVAIKQRKAPGRVAVVGVALVTLGAACISGPPHLAFGVSAWLTVLCAVLFAGHIVTTDIVTRRSPPLAVALSSFVWVTLGSALLLGFGLSGTSAWQDVFVLLSQPGFLQPALLAGVFGTLVGLSLLTHYQRALSPVRAAVLYALEPVWAAMIAVYGGMATVDIWLVGGGSLLLVGNLWMEIWPRLKGAQA